MSLFYEKPNKQGLSGQPSVRPSLDRHFGWMGVLVLLVGFVIASVSLFLGIRGWDVARLWLYFLGSAMFILLGIQLIVFWVLMRVLEELSQREILSERDLAMG